jgi:ATP-dependent RNA helicase DDX52/ROK1
MDLFHLLGGGARFDKNRFKNDISLFEGEKEANQLQSKKKNAAVVDPAVRSQLLDEIDFFKTTHTIVDHPTHVKDQDEVMEDKETDQKLKKGKSQYLTLLTLLTSY